MADAPIVIVDKDGNEHEFPAGFDPKRAADIVRQQTHEYTPDPTMQDFTQRSLANQTSYVPPRKVTDELGNEVGGMAEGPAKNFVRNVVQNPAVQSAAYPGSSGTVLGTLSDLSALMLPNFSGNGYGSVANAVRDTRAALTKPADVVLNTLVKKTGIDPDALSLQATRMRLEAARRATRNVRTAAELATPPTAAPSGPSAARVAGMPVSDEELLAQKLAELQARGRQISTTTPSNGTLVTGQSPARMDELMNKFGGQAPVDGPANPALARATAITAEGRTPAQLAELERITGQPAASHPLTQPRVDVGAEVVGRQNGLTKQQVRGLTQSPLAETPGGASSIVPEQTLDKFFTKMRSLSPEGTERFDYVNAAKDAKTRAQLENLRRTLKLAGLSAAGAAGSRQALVNMMQQDQ